MKDSRIGESLWAIWDGLGYTPAFPDSVTYYTTEHVDVEHELIRKALASSIQRDGLTYSLYEAFQAIDSGVVSQGWFGTAEGELHEEICSEVGETIDGTVLTTKSPATFVEVQYFD